MKIIATTLFAAAFLLPIASPAHALLIDEFNGEVAPTTAGVTFDGVMLGGERDVEGNLNAEIDFSGGIGTFTALTGIASRKIIYDGNDNEANTLNPGLGGVDLTVGGADRFLLSMTSVVSNPSVSLRIYDTADDSVRAGPITVTAPGILEIPFSSFTFIEGSGASFSSVNAIQLLFSDNVASGGQGSISVDYLRTNGVTEIPEPSSMALIGMGLSALGIGRRMKSRSS